VGSYLFSTQIRNSSMVYRWATGWIIRGFESRQGLEICLFTIVSRPALGTILPPIQWIPVAHSLGVKQPGREPDHTPPTSAEVKNVWSYISAPPWPPWRGAQLKKGTETTLHLPLKSKWLSRKRGGFGKFLNRASNEHRLLKHPLVSVKCVKIRSSL
jgi:hypothetical protein